MEIPSSSSCGKKGAASVVISPSWSQCVTLVTKWTDGVGGGGRRTSGGKRRAGNQEHIRRSIFRAFIQPRTIFLDFALFGIGQRAGLLLKPFVFRDATLSGSTGVVV